MTIHNLSCVNRYLWLCAYVWVCVCLRHPLSSSLLPPSFFSFSVRLFGYPSLNVDGKIPSENVTMQVNRYFSKSNFIHSAHSLFIRLHRIELNQCVTNIEYSCSVALMMRMQCMKRWIRWTWLPFRCIRITQMSSNFQSICVFFLSFLFCSNETDKHLNYFRSLSLCSFHFISLAQLSICNSVYLMNKSRN